MENKPEYAAIWLGLSKIGVITALINTNLKSEPLLHSITIAKSKVLIYGSELKDCKLVDIDGKFFFSLKVNLYKLLNKYKTSLKNKVSNLLFKIQNQIMNMLN
jgi:solute carrier family 27 fatty acid transporter 1/4